jgi:hypothetical protein
MMDKEKAIEQAKLESHRPALCFCGQMIDIYNAETMFNAGIQWALSLVGKCDSCDTNCVWKNMPDSTECTAWRPKPEILK